MQKRKPIRSAKPTRTNSPGPRADHVPQTAVERAQSLLLRLETGGPNLVRAAEELDRLQGVLAREERLEDIRERVSDLCEAWQENALRGEQARAWLVLAGGFGLRELEAAVVRLVRDAGQPAPLRSLSCEVLASFGSSTAGLALLEVAGKIGDVQ